MIDLTAWGGLAVPLAIKAAALGGAYLWSDRAAGGGAAALDAKLPGRIVAYLAIGLAVLGFVLGGWPLAVVGLAWAAQRSLAFPTNSLTPGTVGEFALAAGRHALGAVAPLAVVVGTHGDVRRVAVALAAYVAAAVGLGAWYRRAKDKAEAAGVGIGDENVTVERVRGALYGLAVAVGL